MRNAWCETCIVYVRTATSRTPLTEVSRQRSETKKAANIPGPCGRFPFLGVGNQFLTPLQYANLARLGHDLAAAPLAELVEARAAATRRKSSPAAALISRKRAEESSSRF